MATEAAWLALVALLAMLSPALAEPKLLQSTPAADAVIAAPKMIKLTFTEKVTPASGVQLFMSDGMKVTTTTSISEDGKSLTARPTGPFMPGKWTISWHVTSATGESKGSYNFTIE
jgi:methionine-rich copper-binding protein CopC